MKKVQIRNLILDESGTKICVPLTGANEKQILRDIEILKDIDFDLIELRIDYYEHVEDFNKVVLLLENVRKSYYKPILFTFRTKKEGGMHELPEERYFTLNRFIVNSGLIDLIDIELSGSEDNIKDIIDFAHEKNVKVMMSNHDFSKTPSKEEIVNRFVKMQNYDADITKVAVMPNCEKDVLTLMAAALEMKKEKGDRPFVALSMGSFGSVTRLAGNLLGSCLTFAALDKASAPGQINVKGAREILNILGM